MDNPFAKQFKTQTAVAPTEATDNPFVKQFGTTPQDITTANQLGQSPTASKYNGMCQQFVDDVLQTPDQNRQPSASDAWNNYFQTGQGFPGTKGMQVGDLLYFEDPNDPAGHVGFYAGGDKFISATQENPQKPVQSHSLKAWQDLTGQQVLGYVKNPSNLPKIGGQP